MINHDPTAGSPSSLLKMPAWLFSLAVHLVVVVLGVLLVRPSPPAKDIDESDRPAAIVLVRRTPQTTNYFDEQTATTFSAATSSSPAGTSAGDPLTDLAAPPGAAGISLPELPGGLAAGQATVP